MAEPIPATPGWVDARLDAIFAALPEAAAARADFAACLARTKAPAAPSDTLGTEFEPCHAALRRALRKHGLSQTDLETIMRDVEALEAEIAAES